MDNTIYTKQTKKWMNQFGKNYTNRNELSLSQTDKIYEKRLGITRTQLNNLFLGKLSRNLKILEVGANIGNQLLFLKKMGFKNLYGIEINRFAVELAKSRAKNIDIIQASAFDIPFKNNYFDIVFTSGLLIHIAPSDIKHVVQEIYRCSKKYIWGYEYYSPTYKEITYRGKRNLLWKTDFPKLYLNSFNNLELIKSKKLKYIENSNIDIMFLLKKINHPFNDLK